MYIMKTEFLNKSLTIYQIYFYHLPSLCDRFSRNVLRHRRRRRHLHRSDLTCCYTRFLDNHHKLLRTGFHFAVKNMFLTKDFSLLFSNYTDASAFWNFSPSKDTTSDALFGFLIKPSANNEVGIAESSYSK